MVDRQRRPDSGSATIYAIGWLAALLTMTWLVLVLAVATARQHHLDDSADLAALSAAAAAVKGGDPCTSADAAARANRVMLADCRQSGIDVTVRVADHLQLPLGMTVRFVSSARAGPG
jgi:secretion/DNA translocation related TadE-like protein